MSKIAVSSLSTPRSRPVTLSHLSSSFGINSWVPAHTVNFAFIPPSQRLLYINSIQIGYNIFLSFLGNKAADAPAEK